MEARGKQMVMRAKEIMEARQNLQTTEYVERWLDESVPFESNFDSNYRFQDSTTTQDSNALDDDHDDSVKDPDYSPSEKSSLGADLVNAENEDTGILPEAITSNRPVGKKYSRKDRTQRKKDRSGGKAYTTLSGKPVSERQCKELESCRLKCAERFSRQSLHDLFDSYWSLNTYDLRRSYIAGLMTREEKSRSRPRTEETTRNRSCSYRYYLEICGARKNICQKCFLRTFGETKKFLETLQKSKFQSVGGTITTDARGRAPNPRKIGDEKLKEVDDHINSFPAYESHYTRAHSSKMFLPSYLSISRIYQLYKECTDNPVSISIYQKRFHNLNLSFKKPQKDTCNTCDALKMKIDVENCSTARESLIQERNAHQQKAEDAYESKRADKENASTTSSQKVYTFDLEQCLPTPFLQTSVSFYKRQLWTYNLTVHDCQSKKADCFMWYETIAARGANQIASCLFKLLCNLPENIKTVTLYSDTCSGQNKNAHVAVMFMLALQHNVCLQEINHKFLVPGHTHMECDSDHSVIERCKNRSNTKIHHPHDWFQLVRNSSQRFQVHEMKQSDFFSFSDILKGPFVRRKKNVNNEPFLWKGGQWYQYKRPIGKIFYKTSLSESEEFQELNFVRRGRITEKIHPRLEYSQDLPISREKFNDLQDLLPLINPEFHRFYQNIATSRAVLPTFDPDLEEHVDDELL